MPIPVRPRPPARELLRDNVYSSLRDAIVDGTLAPGERLRDTEIESWLGVSRTPIREALLRLERAGLVIAQPGRSTTVAPLDASSTVNAQQIAAAMHELAARLAVPSLTDEHIGLMRQANAAFERAVADQDVDAALDADDRFHDVFLTRSGNAMIAEVLETVTPLLRRIERLRFGSLSARESAVQHREIIAASSSGDVERTAALCRQNWLSLSYVADD